jgi:uncharacterized protein YgfB (UPF0149 family)
VSEPDEALLWAREQSVQFWESLIAKGLPPETVAAHVALARSGGYDSQLEQEAEGRRNWLEGYRAGQAASAETVKALEEAIREAMRRLNEYADMTVDEWDDSVADGGIMAWMVIRQELKTVVVYRLDRALLKEADQ